MNTKYCPKCQQTLPLDLFGVNRSRSDGKQPACIECMRQYRRAHYKNNKQPYHDRARALEAKLRAIVLERKDNPCERCGIEYPGEPWLMEFDHREQVDKDDCIGKMIKQGNLARLLAELDKCDLLCVVCHRRRTALQLGWGK
jgi:hypothetical protein